MYWRIEVGDQVKDMCGFLQEAKNLRETKSVTCRVKSFVTLPLFSKYTEAIGIGDYSFVISEEDYYDMAGRERTRELIPLHIGALLEKRSVVFLGYRLADIHIRHALLRGQGRKHYVFTRTVTEFDKAYWKMLGVEGFAMNTDSFVEEMSRSLLGSSRPGARAMD